MVIYRKYVEEKEWKVITEEEFIRSVEGGGYYKEGTALQALKDVSKLRTPWAYFKVEEVKDSEPIK